MNTLDKERKILIEADSTNNVEHPEDFNWQEAFQRVHNLKPQVEKILGSRLHIDKNVQDATFFTDLALQRRNEVRENFIDTLIAVRFSCFGNLFTIWSNVK